MKLMNLLPALLAALLLLAGCGGSDSPAGSADSKAQRIAREARAVQEAAEKLRGQNDILVERFNRLAPIEVQERLDQQAKELRELEASLDGLLKALKGEGGATPAAAAAASEEGSGLFSTLLLVLVVILALYIIFRLISSRSDFEEEDDFEDWEDDENLGFDDDLEDEFVDEDDEDADDDGEDAGGDGDEKK